LSPGPCAQARKWHVSDLKYQGMTIIYGQAARGFALNQQFDRFD